MQARNREQEGHVSRLDRQLFRVGELRQSRRAHPRRFYLKHRPVISSEWSKLPLEVLKDKRIKSNFRKWRDGMVTTKGARQADLIFATCRRIVSFAVDDGLLEINHLLTIEAVYSADRSDMIWLPSEHIEAFWQANDPQREGITKSEAKQGQTMQLALILALNLGRREGDLIRLTWGKYKGDAMLTNRKGGRKVEFPARTTEALRASLDAYKLSLGRIPHKDDRSRRQPALDWTDDHFR